MERFIYWLKLAIEPSIELEKHIKLNIKIFTVTKQT